MSLTPTVHDIRSAANRLAGHIVHTPLIESVALNELLGGRILLKAESLQKTGSFKFRGALNRICQLSETERHAGVVAFSSGNHAQGVALAASLTQVSSTIVMPEDAPQSKISATRNYGADVILIERDDDLREKFAADLTEERGSVLVRPFDEFDIIAGQGTVGLEVIQQAESMGVIPDAVLCPCGGGGLVSGLSIALQDQWPKLSVFAVEPEGFDDTRRSLETGNRERNSVITGSICDALLAPTPGALTFAINKDRLSGSIIVRDTATKRAMAAAFQYLNLVVEPGGAIALGALLDGQYKVQDKTVVVVLSGGNVDTNVFTGALQEHTTS